MKGLILKDLLNLKKSVKLFGILTIVYGFMAFTQKDTSFFSYIFTMLFAILTISTFSYDEVAKWDSYAITMPISRENIIQAKYIMMLFLTIIGTLFSIVFTIFLNLSLKNHSFLQGTEASLIGAAIVIMFYSITIPIITKLGVEKSRLIFFAVYLIPFFIIYLISKALKEMNVPKPEKLISAIEYMIQHSYYIIPVIIIIALGISYVISLKIYLKKEF